METGRQYSMPSNLNNPILTKQSILLLEDGFCFCSPEEKAFYPFSDFGVTPEDGIAEFLHQKSIVDDCQLILFNSPSILIPSLNYDAKLVSNYWEPYASLAPTSELKSSNSTNGLVRFIYPQTKAISQKLPWINKIPAYALLYDRIIEYSQQDFNKQIYVHLFAGFFDLFITQGTRIIMANRFPHQNEEDFMYYLFYAAEQLQLSENSVKIYFLGEFDSFASYYEGVKNFQNDLHFMETSVSHLPISQDPVPFWNA
jgi:hypothetical protein